jgi:hypothetical protein
MPRIDITNPARSSESLLVIDDRYNTLFITRALLQLAPVMHSKLADALNRTLGTQFTCFTSTHKSTNTDAKGAARRRLDPQL